jgi:hypothetical protein
MAAIFLVNAANDLVELREQAYESESVLQELLARFPGLLSGDTEGEASARWLLVRREMPVTSVGGTSGTWAIDHLFLDQAGVPTLVEVKKSTNTEIRRSIVGQMMDYAANAVVYWPADRIRATFEAAAEAQGHEPSDMVADFLGGEHLVEAFWQNVATNLQAQRVRLIFIADQIPPELRRVIEFLNGQMSPAEVLGIEVRQFAGQDVKTLVPSVVGRTADAEARKGTRSYVRRSDWTWEAFGEELRVPQNRIEVGQRLEQALAELIRVENLDWRIVPRQGYMSVLRPGDYKVAIIDVYWRKMPRIAFKLPATPAELGIESPYPHLAEDWDPGEKEWGWTVPSVDDIPDLRLALSLVRSYVPTSGRVRWGGTGVT